MFLTDWRTFFFRFVLCSVCAGYKTEKIKFVVIKLIISKSKKNKIKMNKSKVQ